MNRYCFAILILTILAPAASAQDMPLSQILIEGEGWKRLGVTRMASGRTAPTTTSPDGLTTFRWNGGPFIEARQTKADAAIPFAPYCPLRVPKGEKSIPVTAMTTDRDGRIYAATRVGLHVYDPTGRLCGVVAVPAGTLERLAFEGDQLTGWIIGAKYSRKLNTVGVK